MPFSLINKDTTADRSWWQRHKPGSSPILRTGRNRLRRLAFPWSISATKPHQCETVILSSWEICPLASQAERDTAPRLTSPLMN